MLDAQKKDESKLWAAKSAIQKAIRRSDLDLLKTSFDVLWGEKKTRSWLKWRLPILVEEEMWYYIPECARFLAEHGDVKNHQAVRKQWLKFLYTMALLPKSKDSEPLYYLSISNCDPPHAEVEDFRAFLKDHADSTAYECAKALSKRAMSEDIGLTDYELDGIKLMVQRSKEGGLPTDAWACLSAIYLLLNRGVGAFEVREATKQAHKSVKQKPAGVQSFPWYVFDQHTRIGAKVLRLFPFENGEKSFMERALLGKLMFLFESAYIPREQINAQPVTATADCFTSVLWVPYINNELRGRGKPVKALKEHWATSIRPRLKNRILDEMNLNGMNFINPPEQMELF